LGRPLPTKRSRLTGKLAGDDTIRKISLVGFTALLGAGLVLLISEALRLSWSVVGDFTLALLAVGLVPMAMADRKVSFWGRWVLGSIGGVMIAYVSPTAAFVVALLLILAPVIAGVPITDLFTDLPTTRLDGVDRSYTSTVETGTEGTIVGERERMPRCWELRDKDGLVLVRGSESSRHDLTVKDGSIELIGPLWIEDLDTARSIDVDEAREKLGVPRSYLFPEELYLAERTLRADEAISVRGELRTEADWVGYRESAFRRRLVGRAGQPLLVRATA
jgi:hypothetical protein